MEALAVFQRMLPELSFNAIFLGSSIEAYTIMNFVGTWSAAQTDGRYFRFRDITQDKQLIFLMTVDKW